MIKGSVLSSGTALLEIIRLEIKRLRRRRGLWVAAGIGFLPAAIPLIQQNRRAWLDVPGAAVVALAVCAPLLLSSLISEEIVDKTASYLFTRPLQRSAILLGKMLAAIPVLIVIMNAPVILSFYVCNNSPSTVMNELWATMLGVTAGAIATGIVAGSWGAVFPKRALPAAVGYLFLFDTGLAVIPFSLNKLSVTRHAIKIAEGAVVLEPLIWMTIISGIWLAIGMWRLRKA